MTKTERERVVNVVRALAPVLDEERLPVSLIVLAIDADDVAVIKWHGHHSTPEGRSLAERIDRMVRPPPPH